MRLLLDTHVFLWYIVADSRLPNTFLAAIQDPTNEVYLSVASVWEAVIKFSLGKLPLPAPAAFYFAEQRSTHGIASLAVDEEVMPYLAALPPIHRDPFDRMLVAQALQHGLTLATIDPEVREYGVAVLAT